jgi:uncharacterized membrane protein
VPKSPQRNQQRNQRNQPNSKASRALTARQEQPPIDEGVRSVIDSQRRITESARSQFQTEFQITRTESVVSPFIPPSWLERYETIQPGLADRAFAFGERQQAHRQEIEKVAVYGEFDLARRAQTSISILSGILFIGAIVLLAIGRSIEGLGAIVLNMATLAGALYFTSQRREKERKAKNELMADKLPKEDAQE